MATASPLVDVVRAELRVEVEKIVEELLPQVVAEPRGRAVERRRFGEVYLPEARARARAAGTGDETLLRLP